MRLDCSALKTIAHSTSLVSECDVVRNGALRLSTPFQYPNGEYIDLFLQRSGLFDMYTLSDFGQTSLYLKDAQAKLDAIRKTSLVEDICGQFRVHFTDEGLSVDLGFEPPTDLSDPILRLVQACMRVAEFASHVKSRTSNPFRDDIQGFLADSRLPHIPDVLVPTSWTDKPVKIDFQVTGIHAISYLLTLSASNQQTAHVTANEIFRKWYDLKKDDGTVRQPLVAARSDYQFVTVYNSKSAVRSEDLRRISEYSKTVAYPKEKAELLSVLKAA